MVVFADFFEKPIRFHARNEGEPLVIGFLREEMEMNSNGIYPFGYVVVPTCDMRYVKCENANDIDRALVICNSYFNILC